MDARPKRWSFSTSLDHSLTAVTILAALFVMAAIANRFVQGNPSVGPAVGTPLEIAGIDWSKRQRTLVIAMQADCPYCTASVPFYQDLVGSNTHGAVQLVAAFPHAENVGRAVLQSYALKIDDVRQVDLKKLRVSGTPTLLLVDSSGVVNRTWVGRLSEPREDEVFAALQIRRSTRTAQPTVSRPPPEEIYLAAVGAASRRTPIIDTRPRSDFRRMHITDSINIPLDELEARLAHEVPLDGDALLYCDYCPECKVIVDSPENQSLCDVSLKVLKRLGLTKVRLIAGGFDDLPVSGTGGSGDR